MAVVVSTEKAIPQFLFIPRRYCFAQRSSTMRLPVQATSQDQDCREATRQDSYLGVDRLAPGEDASAKSAIAGLRSWYTSNWNAADLLTGPLLTRYRTLYESTENLRSPVPTDDDLASPYSTRGSLTSKDLQKLRACSFFWIEAGGITKNRGPLLPGNQLMMKRLSRVYFGFPPDNLPKNSAIGSIDISFGVGPLAEYSLTFSDNGMDKLVLPIPGAAGPASYDNENLLFKRTGPRQFELVLGTALQRASWKKRSQALGASFAMSGYGRHQPGGTGEAHRGGVDGGQSRPLPR